MTNTHSSSEVSDETPVPPVTSAHPASPAASRRRGRVSLAWQGVLALLALFSLIFMGIALVMNTYGRRQVVVESEAKVEEVGKRRVEEVRRLRAGMGPIDPSALTRLTAGWRDEASGYAFLLDRDHRFLAFPSPSS